MAEKKSKLVKIKTQQTSASAEDYIKNLQMNSNVKTVW